MSDAVLEFLDSCYNVKPNKSYMATVFLDLLKAYVEGLMFLLDKLEYKGIQNNVFSWFIRTTDGSKYRYR